jgi:hypothetical protein
MHVTVAGREDLPMILTNTPYVPKSNIRESIPVQTAVRVRLFVPVTSAEPCVEAVCDVGGSVSGAVICSAEVDPV